MLPTELPWYKSKVIMGVIISVLSKILFATGVIGELAPADQAQLADILVLVIGGIGDLVAVGARVVQKEAPKITAGKAKGSAMLPAMMLVAVLPMALGGCATTGYGSPSEIADRTKVDEQAGLLVTLSYTAASRLGTTLIRSGAITDKAVIRKFGELDKAAYQAVLAVRAAYETANAQSFADALAEARRTIAGLDEITKGNDP